MDRRRFLQLSGMAAASSALAGCRKGNEKLIPFLVPPEDGTLPGVANYYASACRQCPAGCGILVKVSSGRARKIEGNPLHPVNRGKLCARGQAALQELYHPDRLRGPMKRSGPRGSGHFTPISWDEALALLLERFQPPTGASPQQALLLTPPLQGYLAELTGRFIAGHSHLQHIAWEPLAPEWRRNSLFGADGVLDYDLAQCQYLLSFGADFLDSHLSPVRFGEAFGRMRQGRPTVRGRFTYIGPRLSLTAASADRWLPARPGTEWAIALGMAKRLVDLDAIDPAALTAAGLDLAAVKRLVAPYSVPHIAELTDVAPADIEAALTEFATIRPGLALAGEHVTGQPNGAEALQAIELLNLLLGNLNAPGGVYLSRASETLIRSSFAELRKALVAMQAGQVATLLIQGVNPVYNLPPSLALGEALEKVSTLVCVTSFLDDTARFADLILPEHANLETWGEVIPTAGSRGRVVGLTQAVVKPLYDTRPFPDILLALAHALDAGSSEPRPETSFIDGLKRRHANDNPDRWNALLAQGGIFAASEDPSPVLAPFKLREPETPLAAGVSNDYPLQLQIYPAPAFFDGRNAAHPWLQQLPDPMTTAVWGSWIEINPRTATALGIGHGDLVEVRSGAGSLRLPAFLYPGIRPELVAIPLGQGHTALGRYAEGRGVNPLLLAGADLSGSPPGMAVIPVALEGLGRPGGLVTAGHPDGSYQRELLGI